MTAVIIALGFAFVFAVFALEDSAKQKSSPEVSSGCVSCMGSGESCDLAGGAPCPNPACPYNAPPATGT